MAVYPILYVLVSALLVSAIHPKNSRHAQVILLHSRMDDPHFLKIHVLLGSVSTESGANV